MIAWISVGLGGSSFLLN